MSAAVRARVMTSRRIQILTLAAAGRTNAQIGARLGITGNAVNCHLRSVYRALGAYDRSHAVALGIRYGYITADRVKPKPTRSTRSAA